MEAGGLVMDHAFTCLVALWRIMPSPASLRIVPISHGHGFLLLSHDQNMGNSWVICRNSMKKPWDRRSTAAGCVENTHTRERTHWKHRRWSCTNSGTTLTYWSICVLSELYYVLPRLHLCHFGQTIQVNSRNKWQNRTNNVHGALCVLSDPIILIRK